MSAPTLWEEGRLSASRVIRLAVLASAIVIALEVALTGRVGLGLGLLFPLICAGAALAVRPSDFFQVGVLPPLLLLGLMAALSMVSRTAIAPEEVGFSQGLINGLAEHAMSLLIGYGLCLGVLAIRHHFLHREESGAADVSVAQANRSGSPAPTRTTSGAPEEKSTTVVGNEPHSPESSTASTC